MIKRRRFSRNSLVIFCAFHFKSGLFLGKLIDDDIYVPEGTEIVVKFYADIQEAATAGNSCLQDGANYDSGREERIAGSDNLLVFSYFNMVGNIAQECLLWVVCLRSPNQGAKSLAVR